MANVSLEGLDQFRAYLQSLPGALNVMLTGAIDVRADAIVTELAAATPIGETHRAQPGWVKDSPDAMTRIVSNPVMRETGKGAPFNYPSAITTGTGDKGVDTVGYSFGFAIGWPHSMSPRQPLHDTWQRIASEPFTEAQIPPTPAGLLKAP